MNVGDSALRRASRIDVNIPVRVLVQGAPSGSLNSPSPVNFEAVPVPTEMEGARLHGTITNLSLNGAFVALTGEVPPLLSRLETAFELEGFGPVVANCIVMWRTVADNTAASFLVPTASSGVGLLFEAIPLEARQAIADLVRKCSALRHHVLVVEDSDTMRRLIVDSLRRLEVNEVIAVTEARHGAEALRMLENKKFDVVVSDLNMPEMDGFKLIRHIRSHATQNSTPILVITSDNDPTDEERAMQLGANGYLMKPLTKSQICEAVRELLKLK